MAERVVNFANGVTVPAAEGSILALYGSMDQDTSLSSLPTAPAVGAHTVRIRGTLTFTSAPAGTVILRVRQGAGTGGAAVDLSEFNGTGVIGSVLPFECVDTAPILPALNYTITAVSSSGTPTANIVAEIEEVN
jgi:hypothetical protein